MINIDHEIQKARELLSKCTDCWERARIIQGIEHLKEIEKNRIAIQERKKEERRNRSDYFDEIETYSHRWTSEEIAAQHRSAGRRKTVYMDVEYLCFDEDSNMTVETETIQKNIPLFENASSYRNSFLGII